MSNLAVNRHIFKDARHAVTPVIATEGIKYAGSKLKLIPYILDMVNRLSPRSVFDGFSGTTRVSQALAWSGYEVTSSDISIWSETLGRCYLQGRAPSHYEDLIRHLNACPPKDGWFTQYYGAAAQRKSEKKAPWQNHNTRKLDGIREEIENLSLDVIDKAVALTSLMLALDKVDSTLGHFVSYLKDWPPRSFNNLLLTVPKIVESEKAHEVIRGDIFDTIQDRKFDLVYLDPPYGSNNGKMPPSRVRYASYYHIWTTICLNDAPQVFGAANRRADSRDTLAASVFEEFRQDDEGNYLAVKAIRKLLAEVNAEYIILSYSSGGRATATELHRAIKDVGRLLEVREINYRKNVMSGMRWTDDWVKDVEEKNVEFLFLIRK